MDRLRTDAARTLRRVEPDEAGLAVLSHAPGRETPAEAQRAWMAGRAGGGPLPAWVDGSQGAWWGEETVWRAGPGWWWPAHGAFADDEGRVMRPTLGAPRPSTPDLADLPGVDAQGAFRPPARARALDAASLFAGWGGTFNYGHFLLDSLPALVLLDEAGALDAAPAAAPRLRPWQRELVRMALGGRAVREVGAPVVRLGAAAFASPMDHFLHHPNRVLARLRARVLARAPPPAGPVRVYLSRRGQSMRVMTDEPELEAALAARGFAIVRPERLSASAQVALMRGARAVVAPTGAALANALFCPPDCQVVEIQPQGFTSQWVRALRQATGGEWAGWFTPAPIDPRAAPWTLRMRRGFRFAYRAHVPDLLAFLDERLG